jgi:stage III sporulation protein AG
LHRILNFFKGGGNNGAPPKEQGRRNLWLATLGVLGIVLLVIANTGGSKPAGVQPEQVLPGPAPEEKAESSMSFEEEQIAGKLREMLRQVDGAGKVEVSVRLSGSTREEYAVNTTTGKKTTQERDQTGGTRLTTEDTNSGQLVMNRSETGEERPVVEREVAPQVAGVLVVAQGAGDSRIKARLFEATRVALGIDPQRILVLKMERRE